jgi:hypothetical protein
MFLNKLGRDARHSLLVKLLALFIGRLYDYFELGTQKVRSCVLVPLRQACHKAP